MAVLAEVRPVVTAVRTDRPFWRRNVPLTIVLDVVLVLGAIAFVSPFLWMGAT